MKDKSYTVEVELRGIILRCIIADSPESAKSMIIDELKNTVGSLEIDSINVYQSDDRRFIELL